MTEYTYHAGVLRIRSDAAIAPQPCVTVVREDAEKIVTTRYRLGHKLKEEQSGGHFYQWWGAVPQTVTIDNSPALRARLLETQLAVAELAELMQGGDLSG